jgi:hypothetical protein
MKWIVLTILITGNLLQAMAQKDSTHKKRVNITGIPIISYNSSYGVIVGANGMAFFNLNRKDTISPASQVGIGMGYTQNKSFFASAFAQLYFKEDTWRTTTAFGTGNINFQYFEASNEADGGDFVDYNTVNRFAFFKALRKIKGRLYGGAFVKLQHSVTDFKTNPDSTQNIDANGIGLTMLYDTRKNVYYPQGGMQASVSFLVNAAWLGSDSVFNSIRAFINKYYRINKNSVLAARASIFAGLGNVPFSGQHAVGGKDIRGYTNGKYRGDQEYSAQAEYRWNFYKRWGAVGFFGIAFTELPYSGILPGGGVGIRFKAIRSRNINVGVDGALGKGDKGIYFRINEAF